MSELPIKREIVSNEENEREITQFREIQYDLPRETTIIKDHPKDLVIGDE